VIKMEPIFKTKIVLSSKQENKWQKPFKPKGLSFYLRNKHKFTLHKPISKSVHFNQHFFFEENK